MFTVPPQYASQHRKLSRQLKPLFPQRGKAAFLARLTLNVELTIELLFKLGLGDEYLLVAPFILSGTFIRHERLQNFSDAQQHAIANARVLLRDFAGRFAWEQALRDYIRQIPTRLRLYNFDVDQLKTQIIDNCTTKADFPDRKNAFEMCLSQILPFKSKILPLGQAGEVYKFSAQQRDISTKDVDISFSTEQLADVEQSIRWFPSYTTNREPMTVSFVDLQAVAVYFDEVEKAQKPKRSVTEKKGGMERHKTWKTRLDEIEYFSITSEKSLERSDQMRFDGLVNLVGMVASGKTTLAILIAGYMVLRSRCSELFPHLPPENSPKRITMIVGDTMTAIRLSDQLNRFFCNDPETDSPVAVPLLGQTTRDEHLQQLYQSRDYQQAIVEGRIHWGERFLNTNCLLQALLPIGAQNGAVEKPLVPGTEPCSGLMSVPPPNAVKHKPKRHICPFAKGCRVHQRYHDMPNAQIWITTPGALGNSTLPNFVDPRQVYLGDIVYEQSNLVIFDEVDTVSDWFDRLYAQEILLTHRGKGILDKIHEKISPYWSQNRLLSASTSRWVEAQNNGINPLSHVLKQLAESQHLRDWLTHGYFTARNLFYKLARRMVGLKEYEDSKHDSVRLKNEKLINPIMEMFERLLEDDPLENPIPAEFRRDRPVTLDKLTKVWRNREKAWTTFEVTLDQICYRLSDLMQRAMTTGDSTQNRHVLEAYKRWIVEFVPDIEQRLDKLRTELATSDKEGDKEYSVDTLETVAQRLEFVLNAALLDRHNRIIFYEWHNRPNHVISGVQPYRRVPSSLVNVLPLPPTGRMFGIYYRGKSSEPDDKLSSFAYTNIGRAYVLDFHRLRSWLDGQPGPHVLFMSGTSYLPHSTRFHIGGTPDAEPKGVLKPNPLHTSILKSIQESMFTFLPMYPDMEERGIRVSGTGDMLHSLVKLTQQLIARQGGYLGVELRELKRLGDEQPDKWADRARLLLFVNSYEESEWVARQIRQQWTEKSRSVFQLIRPKRDNDLQIRGEDEHGRLIRNDIERFADTKGEILIAPLQSIGRGFNILNQEGKAAFGAVYFLTRPMPHPYDTPAIIQELNRRAYDWFNDENFYAWQADGIYGRAVALRRAMNHYWTLIEQRSYYSTLWDAEEYNLYPRSDIAATTAGTLIQAVGRSIRGGVPFRAYFVDAAWAPESAKYLKSRDKKFVDTPSTSLLVAVIDVLAAYAADMGVGQALYAELLGRLEYTANLYY
jgi:hypothetical protein